jgi:hypothetical protein
LLATPYEGGNYLNMCVLCTEATIQIHWTDRQLSGYSLQTRRQDHNYRVQLLNKVLSYYGLNVDNWNGVKFIIRDKKGRSEIVQDLAELWEKANGLVKNDLDPLDEGFIAFMTNTFPPKAT